MVETNKLRLWCTSDLEANHDYISDFSAVKLTLFCHNVWWFKWSFSNKLDLANARVRMHGLLVDGWSRCTDGQGLAPLGLHRGARSVFLSLFMMPTWRPSPVCLRSSVLVFLFFSSPLCPSFFLSRYFPFALFCLCLFLFLLLSTFAWVCLLAFLLVCWPACLFVSWSLSWFVWLLVCYFVCFWVFVVPSCVFFLCLLRVHHFGESWCGCLNVWHQCKEPSHF